MSEAKVKIFDIWCEGFMATGESSGANSLGCCSGKDLKEACINFAKTNKDFANYFNEDRMTYWGCRIFDNEADARKSFG